MHQINNVLRENEMTVLKYYQKNNALYIISIRVITYNH